MFLLDMLGEAAACFFEFISGDIADVTFIAFIIS